MKRLIASILLPLLLSACGGSSSNNGSTTAPTPSTPVTEPTFTGTVQQQGSQFTTFQINAAGTVTVTLTTAGPPPTIFMGVGIGTQATGPNGLATCTLAVQMNLQAGQTLSASATGAIGGCVSIYDIGNQTAPVDFSITITHF